MPTYQYRCTACGNELEKVQKFSDPALTVCESCGGALRKVYSAVGVVFKGSGFYATDNRSKGSSSASIPAADKASSSDSSTSSSTSSTSTSTSSEGGSSSTPAASKPSTPAS